MKLIRYNGGDIRLPERDWKQLLNRFDTSRASLNIEGYYCIHVPALCKHYNYRCFLCPLGSVKHEHGTNLCTHVFDSIMGADLSQYVYLFDPAVVWSPEYDAEARRALQRIREVLSAESGAALEA